MSARVCPICFITLLVLLLAPDLIDGDITFFDLEKELYAPLYQLPDETIITFYRERGYRKTARHMRGCNEFFCNILLTGPDSTIKHTGRELHRIIGVICGKAGNDFALQTLEKMIDDAEFREHYMKIRKTHIDFHDRNINRKDRSPGLEQEIKQSISFMKRIGYRATGMHEEDLADFYFSSGLDEKGLECLQRALLSHIEVNCLSLASHVAGRIGVHFNRKGNPERAGYYYSESLSYARKLEDPYYISRSLAFLASLRTEQGYYAEAESLYIHSLRQCKRLADPNFETMRMLELAGLYFSIGEYAHAAQLAERVIFTAEHGLEEIFIGKGISSANDLKTLLANTLRVSLSKGLSLSAKIQCRQGELETAAGTMKRACEIYGDGMDRHLTAKLEKQLGDVYAATGKAADAERCYRNALASARKLKQRRTVAEYLASLASLYYANGSRKRAEKAITNALALAREENDWMRTIDILYILGSAAVSDGDRPGGLDYFRKAFDVFSKNSTGKEFFEDRHILSGRMRQIYEEACILEAETTPDGDRLILWYERSKAGASGSSTTHAPELETRVGLCLADRNWIPECSAVLAYLVTPEKTLIIVLDRHGTAVRSAPVSRAELEQDVLTFLDHCSSRSDTEFEESNHMESTACRLYSMLVSPVSALVSGRETICIIPDGILHYLPFGALVKPDGGGAFLMENLTLFFSPSLVELHQGSTRPAGEAFAGGCNRFDNVLLIGNTEIPPAAQKLYPHLKHLPHAEIELEAVESMVGGYTVLGGREATREAVIERAVSADVLHFATHTVNYPVHGGKTALLLSSPAEISDEHSLSSSLLAESDITAMDLSGVRLVVLSSCESARGRPRGSNTGPGLAGAFIGAGAETVVASLWSIEDRAALQIVSAFFSELLSGPCTPAEALCNSRRAMIDASRKHGDPLDSVPNWAAFVAFGSF